MQFPQFSHTIPVHLSLSRCHPLPLETIRNTFLIQVQLLLSFRTLPLRIATKFSKCNSNIFFSVCLFLFPWSKGSLHMRGIPKHTGWGRQKCHCLPKEKKVSRAANAVRRGCRICSWENCFEMNRHE